MKTIDLHQDLMTHIRFRDVLQQSVQTDFSLLEKSDVEVVLATAFPFPPDGDQFHESVSALIAQELQMYADVVADSDIWSIALCGSDIDTAGKKLILHLEGLNVFDGSRASWDMLQQWCDMGVHSIGTHWNLDNDLGGGTLNPTKGLTALGAEVVQYIEEKNIILDTAHMSRQTFYDVAAIATRPLYVSHGNADTVCNNVRNYTDEQLYSIAESGGVIGVFFPSTFVCGAQKQCALREVIAHIQYIKDFIGIAHIAIGSDFGGIVSGTVQGLSTVLEIENLWSALRAVNFSQADIEAIAYDNAYRVLKAHLA